MPFLASDSFNLLAINPGLVFWTVITFVTVLTILWLFAWKPIIDALDIRNDKIESELKESQRLREDAEKLLKDYEAKIESAKDEATSLLETSKKEAEEAGVRIIKKAEEKNQAMATQAKKEIAQARLAVIQEIQDSIVNTTIQIVSKILKTDVTDAKHKKLIVDELKNTSLT